MMFLYYPEVSVRGRYGLQAVVLDPFIVFATSDQSVRRKEKAKKRWSSLNIIEEVGDGRWKRSPCPLSGHRQHSWEDAVELLNGFGFQVFDAPELNGLIADQEGGKPVRLIHTTSEGCATTDGSPVTTYALVWTHATGKNWLIDGYGRLDIGEPITFEEAQDSVTRWAHLMDPKTVNELQDALAQRAPPVENQAANKAVGPKPRKQQKKRR